MSHQIAVSHGILTLTLSVGKASVENERGCRSALPGSLLSFQAISRNLNIHIIRNAATDCVALRTREGRWQCCGAGVCPESPTAGYRVCRMPFEKHKCEIRLSPFHDPLGTGLGLARPVPTMRKSTTLMAAHTPCCPRPNQPS